MREIFVLGVAVGAMASVALFVLFMFFLTR